MGISQVRFRVLLGKKLVGTCIFIVRFGCIVIMLLCDLVHDVEIVFSLHVNCKQHEAWKNAFFFYSV